MKRALLITCLALLLAPPQARAQACKDCVYKIDEKVSFDETCKPWESWLKQRIAAAVNRLEDCLNYAHVTDRIGGRMVLGLTLREGIRVICAEPPSSRWCAAGGYGQVWFSPTRALARDSICYPDIGSYFIHEVGHTANLEKSPSHDERGEGQDRDEVYSLQRYCMSNTRNWIGRGTRTADVVKPERLACVRAYQEQTPSTLVDPFWKPLREARAQGRDACAEPLPKIPGL